MHLLLWDVNNRKAEGMARLRLVRSLSEPSREARLREFAATRELTARLAGRRNSR